MASDRRVAWSRRLAAAAADSSTRAAFCWVIWSSWLTAPLTWPMPLDCSTAADEISPTMSPTRCTELTMSLMVVPALPTSWAPDSTASTELPIKALISRAGEQGRGFAVVAGEVRTLAQRSAQAAREIKGLIGQSVENVDAGAKMVDTTGATMQEIVAQFKRVADLIGEIGAATREQTSGIGQVSDAVAQLDRVTQQNAALVEESAAGADSLKSQAQQLEAIVSRFKLARHTR